METNGAVASFNAATNEIDIWAPTQAPFFVRKEIAHILGLERDQVRVRSVVIGGGFGGKTHVWMEPVALALSRKANRPVKVVMTREEVFKASGPTSSTSVDVKIGCTKAGRIVAAEATLRYQTGAFPGIWGMSFHAVPL